MGWLAMAISGNLLAGSPPFKVAIQNISKLKYTYILMFYLGSYKQPWYFLFQ